MFEELIQCLTMSELPQTSLTNSLVLIELFNTINSK
jgi:hypothetical protein